MKSPAENYLKKLFFAKDIFAGLLASFLSPIFAISAASLIFSGYYASYLAVGTSITLAGVAITNFVMAPTSEFKYAISGIDTSQAALIAVILASILNLSSTADFLYPTMIAALIIFTLITGIILFAIGALGYANFVRYIPYPVIGGFTAGTGWLIFKGAIIIMSPLHLTLANIIHPSNIASCLPAIGFGVLIQFCVRTFKGSYTLPVLIFSAIPLTFLTLWLFHVSYLQAVQNNWLYGPITTVVHWSTLHPNMVYQVDWRGFWEHSNYFLSTASIVVLMQLLNITALEVATDTRVNMDYELKIGGIANIINGLFFGLFANLRFSPSLICHNLGARNRLAGILVGLVCLAIVIFKLNILVVLPKLVVAGLLLSMGASFLIDWIFLSWKKLHKTDYFIIIVILATIMFFGVLQGVAIGIGISSLLFLIRYSSINFIKFIVTGETHQSNRQYSASCEHYLHSVGKQIQLFKLQGSLFFGSATKLLEKLSAVIEGPPTTVPKFLILDFQFVPWLDSSVGYSFLGLRRLAVKHNVQLIFCHCNDDIIKQLGVFNLLALIETYQVRLFVDSDRAIEWCENEILSTTKDLTLHGTLSDFLQTEDVDLLKQFLNYLTRINLPTDYCLFKQGELSDCMYFLESGRTSAYLESAGKTVKRIYTSYSGAILGEIGFYLQTVRSATVVTEEPCIVYKLTDESLNKMREEIPGLVNVFYETVIHNLAQRLMRANDELALLNHVS